MKHIIKDYFNYTRNELRGIYFLLFIIALLIGYNIYYNRMVPEIDIQQYSDLEKKLKEIKISEKLRRKRMSSSLPITETFSSKDSSILSAWA